MMFHTINIKNKKYLLLPNSLMLFDYRSEILDIAEDLEKNRENNDSDNVQVIKGYLEKEKKSKIDIDNFISKYHRNEMIKISGCDINITYDCNLSCKYCFACENNYGKTDAMTKQAARETMDYIFNNSSKDKKINVTIMGGEPLLNIPVFEEILNYGESEAKSKDRKICFSSTTNGTLLNQDTAEMLRKHDVAYIISLDSHIKEINDFLRPAKTGKGSYDSVVNKLNLIKKNINVNVTVTPMNLNICELARTLFEKGVYHIHFYLAKTDSLDMQFTRDDIGYLKNEYDKLADLLLKKINDNEIVSCYPLLNDLNKLHSKRPVLMPCSTLNSRIAFSPDGNIYPCIMLMNDNQCVGDIRNGINKEKLRRLKNVLADEGECKGCWARYLCGGQCLADKLWENKEQKLLRCELKRHVFSLKLYIYDHIVKTVKGFEFNRY